MPFQFQNQEQRRNAEQSVQADAPQNQVWKPERTAEHCPLYMG